MPLPEPPDTEDDDEFGLHYPLDIALATWRRLQEHGALLEMGSYLDQPSAWQRDMEAIYRRYARVMRAVLAEKAAADGAESGDFDMNRELQAMMPDMGADADDDRLDLWAR